MRCGPAVRSIVLHISAVFFGTLAFSYSGPACIADDIGKPQSALAPLVTGKSIPPRQTARQNVGSMPMNIVFSPDGRYLISSDMGNRQSLWSINASNGAGVSHLDFSNKGANARS